MVTKEQYKAALETIKQAEKVVQKHEAEQKRIADKATFAVLTIDDVTVEECRFPRSYNYLSFQVHGIEVKKVFKSGSRYHIKPFMFYAYNDYEKALTRLAKWFRSKGTKIPIVDFIAKFKDLGDRLGDPYEKR